MDRHDRAVLPVGRAGRTARRAAVSISVPRAPADLRASRAGDGSGARNQFQQRVRVATLLERRSPAAGRTASRPGARASRRAVEKPPFRWSDHCIGSRTPLRPVEVEVLAHPDLLAVDQHRRPGQREQQAVRELSARRSPPSMGGARRRSRGRRGACPRRARSAAKTSSRSLSLSLSRRELVVVAQEHRPRRSGGPAGGSEERLGSGSASPRTSESYSVLHRRGSRKHRAARRRPRRRSTSRVARAARSPRRAASRRRADARGTRAAPQLLVRVRRALRRPSFSRRNGTASTRKPDTPS